MVAALRPMGEVALLPQEFLHTEVGLEQMAYAIVALGEDTRVIMEATGRYHEPIAAALHEYGIYVCVLNPLFIKQSGGGSIRKVKTDKADAMKIAKYGLDNWVELREYTPMDTVRQQLKLCSRQYNLYMKTVVSLQNNLISLTDKTFPGVNELFSSPERADGHQKWVDFVMTFWHCDCICRVSEKAFTDGELIVLDSHIAAHDLPLLEVVSLVGRCGQGDRRTGGSLCGRCGSRSVAAAGHGDGMLGRRGLGYRNRQTEILKSSHT